VCLSVAVIGQSSVEMAGHNKLVFGVEVTFDQSYTMLQDNSDITINKDTSLLKFVRNSGLILPHLLIVVLFWQLSSTQVDTQVINWTVIS